MREEEEGRRREGRSEAEKRGREGERKGRIKRVTHRATVKACCVTMAGFEGGREGGGREGGWEKGGRERVLVEFLRVVRYVSDMSS